jgi:transposase
MEEINRFVTLARSGHFTVTDRCEQFGISLKTGYKHLERYAQSGLAGLPLRSHQPHTSPLRTGGQSTRLGY